MKRAATLVVAILAACGAPRNDGDRNDEAVAAPAPAAPPRPAKPVAPADPRRWIAGDLHQHIAPFDQREGASLTIADIARRAPALGLEFVIVTPHLTSSIMESPAARRAWMTKWSGMAAEARRVRGVAIIPGAEWTLYTYGHFGVSGIDLAAIDGNDVNAAAAAAGGLVIVNHPFALPTKIRGIGISHYDLSFRPWTRGTGAVPTLHGVEVWNLPLGLANLTSRPGGLSGEARAWAAADELARRERQPIATVGGSDSHGDHMLATTWVLAAAATEQAILAALRGGATCVGGVGAGVLTARGDRDPPDRWARIGESVRAERSVELRWTGRARLFVDGADAGEHDGGWVHGPAAGVHSYRIEIGSSRCSFIYANLANAP